MNTVVLDDSWRALNKLRARVGRSDVNLFAAFNTHDKDKTGLCSEAIFAHALSSELETELTDREIGELADLFRIQDGRIDYGQMCGLVHSHTPEIVGKPTPVLKPVADWTTETEPNRLSQAEEKHVLLLLNKFAAELRSRETIQRPYFQDYELAFKPDSRCTLAHFARAIASRGFKISSKEFSLLARRYACGPQSVSYAAFSKALDDAMRDMDAKGNYLLGGEVVEKFPGKLDDINLPVFPRVQTDHTKAYSVFMCDPKKVFHESLNADRVHKLVLAAIKNLQRHVKLNNLRVCSYFYPEADPMKRGNCNQSHFRRAMERMLCGPEVKQRCYVSPQEMDHIIMQYRDPTDEFRVCWDVFTDDLNKVFEEDSAHEKPKMFPSNEVLTEAQPEKVVPPWQLPEPVPVPGWLQVVKRVLTVARRRKLTFDQVKRPFNHYDDRDNPDGAIGHVSRDQMRQCFLDLGILLSALELSSLEDHYNDSISFNYFSLINDLMNEAHREEAYQRAIEISERTSTNFYKEEQMKRAQSEKDRENDVISVMAKIKFKSVNDNKPITQKLRQFAKNSSRSKMTEEEFYTVIQSCKFSLNPYEMSTLLKAFAYPDCSKTVDHEKFCALLDEAETSICTAETFAQHPVDHEKQWLNFEQRHIFSVAMQKLADHRGDINARLIRCFRAYDTHNCGSVSRNHLTRVLANCGLLGALANREIDEIARCFKAKPRQPGLTHANWCVVDTCAVDYISLLRALEVLHATKKYNPFKM
ncbi:uncharacterized protein LOC113386357 [Ctenocephalides felis]|uniref:uncharacterized protein LOC113386357 n=1 Tax=Ctenocephalides felis TaxID=7515 RepID=UPI000E6E38A3|nr:uncharacterized protein LOC113386357 [Ctenocephalides felis]